MTVVDIAPYRLELMCQDSHPDVLAARSDYVEQLDPAQRPIWIIEEGEGTYTGVGQGLVDGDEVYVLSFVGETFGRGRQQDNEYEIQAREMVAACLRYLWEHSQLQFTNDHDLKDDDGNVLAQLVALPRVMFATIRKGPVTLHSKGAEENFWGCVLTVTINEREQYTERMVART